MGNKFTKEAERWESHQNGGDFRVRYRSWRKGDETNSFTRLVPIANHNNNNNNNPSPPLSSTNNLPPRESIDIPLDPVQLELWLHNHSPPLTHTYQHSPSPILPTHLSSSVADLMMEELCTNVTNELVGPRFTSVLTQQQSLANSSPTSMGISSMKSSTSHNPHQAQSTSVPHSTATTNSVLNHLFDPVYTKVKTHLLALPFWYRTNTSPSELAFHIRILLEAKRTQRVVVALFDDHYPRDYVVVIVCAQDRRNLLDAITRSVSSRASIKEATIVTTGDGYALDRFVLDQSFLEEDWTTALKLAIEHRLATTRSSAKTTPPSIPSTPPLIPNTKVDVAANLDVPFQTIRLLHVLGEGRSGRTFLAELKGERVAAKVINVGEEVNPTTATSGKSTSLDEFRRELHLVSKLDHPNVIKFLGASIRPPRYILLFELCECDLWTVVSGSKRDLKFSVIQYLLDIAQGLRYLHANTIIHRDVKPENLMLDKSGVVKVGDFGLSCYVSGHNTRELSAETGTYRFMAPEVMKHERYSYPVDVYSFGMVAYVLIARKAPFDELTPLQTAMAVAKKNARPKLAGLNLPPSLLALLQACWLTNPLNRPDFDGVIRQLHNLRSELNRKNSKRLDWGVGKDSSPS